MSIPKPKSPLFEKRKRDVNGQDAKQASVKVPKAVGPVNTTSSSSVAFSSNVLAEPPSAMTADESRSDLEKLHEINFQVRAHFKKGYKSNNKIYWDKDKDKHGAEIAYTLPDKKLTISREKLQEKIKLRHSAAEQASFLIGQVRRTINVSGGSPRKAGDALLKMEVPAGNCDEMAKAALSLALQKQVGMTGWLLSIGRPGDHVACLFNDGTPPTCPMTMLLQLRQKDAWIVDPWANLVCSAAEYATLFMEKMQKWSGNSKYIHFENEDGEPGWQDPASPTYLQGFLLGKLSFTRFDH